MIHVHTGHVDKAHHRRFRASKGILASTPLAFESDPLTKFISFTLTEIGLVTAYPCDFTSTI